MQTSLHPPIFQIPKVCNQSQKNNGSDRPNRVLHTIVPTVVALLCYHPAFVVLPTRAYSLNRISFCSLSKLFLYYTHPFFKLLFMELSYKFFFLLFGHANFCKAIPNLFFVCLIFNFFPRSLRHQSALFVSPYAYRASITILNHKLQPFRTDCLINWL